MRPMPLTALITALVALLAGVVLLAAIAFGGPGEPAPMASINNPFRTLDYSAMPALSHFKARDGSTLAYRAYAPQPTNGAQSSARGSVVLVHGSSAQSNSLHVLAEAFAAAGIAAYALDMRGHGASGNKGHIDHVGQLEDDLEDFMRTVQPATPATLAGFSAGGGFALRVAAGDRQRLFAHYLLLSPFISQDAPTYRPGSGGWVKVGVPRFVAITLLDALGITAFNHLPVTRFALNTEAKAFLTPQYSYALAQNFRPKRDYRASIRSAAQSLELLAGRDDEAFYAERFADLFAAEGRPIPVTLLPGVGHIALTLDATAVQAAVAAVLRMNSAASAVGAR
jgi:non-heme chloroperoxidase